MNVFCLPYFPTKDAQNHVKTHRKEMETMNIDAETGEVLDESKSLPVRTQDARESQLIAMAYDAVEERIRNGTATSQELVHFLKLGTKRERIEQEILERQKELVTAKTEALQSQRKVEELFANALDYFKIYAGYGAKSDDEREDLQ
jgi:hypothetical protein